MQTISYSFEVKIFIGLCHIHEVTVSLIIRAFGLSNTNLLGNSNFEQPNHLLVTFTTNPQGKTFISCPSEAKHLYNTGIFSKHLTCTFYHSPIFFAQMLMELSPHKQSFLHAFLSLSSNCKLHKT